MSVAFKFPVIHGSSKFLRDVTKYKIVAHKYNGMLRDAAGSHILTVDVDESPQSTFDHGLPIGDGVMANTLELLQLLGDTQARATFFILGRIAEKHPELAPQIVEAGHEITPLSVIAMTHWSR